MHQLILVLREQMKVAEGDVRVIEIFPPAVKTELHDKKHQPDIEDGGNIGMDLEEFTEEAWRGLVAGEEDIAVGMSKGGYEAVEMGRKKVFEKMLAAGVGKL